MMSMEGQADKPTSRHDDATENRHADASSRRPAGTFEVIAQDSTTGARAGVLWTAHGAVETPVFMPVGTKATVKSMSPRDLNECGAQILLGNTYHLMVRPGVETVAACGGLHTFMGGDKPILTDSGGFQVFSLANIRKVTDDGVKFQSHIDGKAFFLGPKEAMEAQRLLGSDIAMCFDECVAWPATEETACNAVEKTLSWAAVCREQVRAPGQLVFGIVQGSTFPGLRERCARGIVSLGFDGHAVGGVSVGEPEPVLLQGVRDSVAWLPDEKPRYVMGLGGLGQIVESVAMGVDMFDCVMPTRLARHGTAFTARGPYPVKAGAYREDPRPVEEGCGCYCCGNFSRAYLRHLLNVGESLGVHLLTLHNIHRYHAVMRGMRAAIIAGDFGAWREEWSRTWVSEGTLEHDKAVGGAGA